MKLYYLIQMMRPLNTLMTALGVVIGTLFLPNRDGYTTLLMVITAISVVGFGNIINDVYDIETDKIAHPNRVLPSSKISLFDAKIFATFLVLLSILLSIKIDIAHFIGTLIPILLLIMYAIRLKGTPLIGNIVVSILVAYPLIYGAIGGDLFSLVFPTLLAFTTNLNREVVKDICDMRGDRKVGIITTVSLGLRNVYKIIYVLIVTNFILLFTPTISPLFRSIYPWGALLIVLPLQIWGGLFFISRQWYIYSKNLKYQLLVGLLLVGLEGIKSIIQ